MLVYVHTRHNNDYVKNTSVGKKKKIIIMMNYFDHGSFYSFSNDAISFEHYIIIF